MGDLETKNAWIEHVSDEELFSLLSSLGIQADNVSLVLDLLTEAFLRHHHTVEKEPHARWS